MSERTNKTSFLKSKITNFKNKAKKASIPGFEGVPIYYVVKFFISGAKNGYLATRASDIAFHFALAIFPSMLFLFTLIPFIPVQNLQIELLQIIKDFLPQNAYGYVESGGKHQSSYCCRIATSKAQRLQW